MLCFVLEDMQSLKEFNVEDEAHRAAPEEVQRRLQHARDHTVPQLFVVSGNKEELVGGVDALNEELTSRRLYDRLRSAGISYLSPDVDDYW
jgi:glutaredoxin-related protein